jgi:adenylate kinase
MISTGDMLRAAIVADTPLGKQAKAIMERGDLLPDPIITGVVEERLSQPDAQNGFLLDGFPRTVAQADALLKFLKDNNTPLDAAVAIEAPDEVIISRLAGRLTCRSCSNIFGPMDGTKCPECGGDLYIRADDQPEAVRHRLEVYRKSTEPLIEFYRGHGILKIVDGNRPRDEVAQSITAALSTVGSAA